MEDTVRWTVVYTDDTTLSQDDEGGQFKNIDWPRVKHLVLDSEQVETRLNIQDPPPEHRHSLLARHSVNLAGGHHKYFVLLVHRDEEPCDLNVIEAFYWFADGSVHHCDRYWCPETASYAATLARGESAHLPHDHSPI